MRKGFGKGASKGMAKRALPSRSRAASRARSSWGGNTRRAWSRPSSGGSGSWIEGRESGGSETGSFGLSTEAGWDGTGLGADLAQGLGEGLMEGLGHQQGSAPFWRGVAACALVVAAIVLVLTLAR